ncbi:V4R domain-containing protein [Solibacillus sp. FSL W7-1436]|uniref:V4R domain-containing protein n=1 Tax=Solibacillus sp. FSL W7-1436 TaxID=2921705 RepID=UPI0030FB5D8A
MRLVVNTSNISTDLIITSQGFGLMRKALIENIGVKRANSFLFHFGRDLGVSKAEELMRNYSSVEDLINLSSEVHRNLGQVSGIEALGRITKLTDGTLAFEEVYGKWFDSFEAKLHLEHFGLSSQCACYTLSGFASGYLSTIYNEEIYVIETKCQTMGYPDCSFEINSKRFWIEKQPDNDIFKQNPTIFEELSLTYDNLLNQKRTLNKVLTYHSQLSDCVVKEDSLNHVLSTAYDLLNIPIIIKNIHNKIVAVRGITEEEYAKINTSSKNRTTLNRHNETMYEKIGTFYEMSTPINLDHKKFATCSFIYNKDQAVDDNDYLFLERLASVATLCFMKEKISFETTERLKISVLDQLINQQHASLNEFPSHLNYISNNIEGPYYILKIKIVDTKNQYLLSDSYDQLLQLSQAFKLFYIDALLTLLQNDIVVLIYNGKPMDLLTKELQKVVAQIQKNNPDLHYKIGISIQSLSLTNLPHYVKQANHAVNLPRNKTIITYDEIGILGNFLSNTDLDTIKQIAMEELKGLLKKDNEELLYTLYRYLINGKHLEKTMQDLSLSMGGLQYRIRKIEDITAKNLKEFSTASYLLLLIESLITLGELKW